MSKPPDLQALREAIENVDREILARLKDRMAMVEQIAEAKLDRAYPFRDQLREEAVLTRVRRAAVELGLDAHEVERLYRSIMEMSIAHQQAHIHQRTTTPLRVSYQGVEGSYTHLTAQRKYRERPGGSLLTGVHTFREAVAAVRDGEADVALLPIENTTAGGINDTYDLLAEGGITIISEVVSHIEHCLLALPGSKLEDLRTVFSHPQGLLQCADFFRTVPWITPVTEFDTAGSARKVKSTGDPTLAAVASESAGTIYGLEVLRKGIQTQTGNYTRFVEVAIEGVPCPPDARVKTSLLVELSHESGNLAKVLGEFSSRNINLTKLESRPILGTPWQYRFYIDVEAHSASASMGEALDAIRPSCVELRALGTYPSGEEGLTAEPSGS